MDGPITKKARDRVGNRISVGSLNPYTLQVEHRPMDGTDVAGMLEPIIVALGELEARLIALEGQM